MISIERRQGNLSGVVRLTPSKSITNRVLIIRALSGIDFKISNKATANDSAILEKILTNLPPVIDAGDAGTTYRFLVAYLSRQPGEHILTGSVRMKERPVGTLVKALNTLGAEITYLEKPDYPPLRIKGQELKGNNIVIDAATSSQFISALLLIAPNLPGGLTIELKGKVASMPYITMTASLMRQFGIDVEMNGKFITVKSGSYTGLEFVVENDWSSASFWYVMAAFSDKAELTLNGLKEKSIQGDSVIEQLMIPFGIRTVFKADHVVISKADIAVLPAELIHDFSNCPDLVIPMAVLGVGLNVNCHFTGVRNLRLKESDRLHALKSELEKIGTMIKIEEDSIIIRPGELSIAELIHTHDDHRMAMAFAALSLKTDIVLDDATVVKKSYPEFWNQLREMGFNFYES